MVEHITLYFGKLKGKRGHIFLCYEVNEFGRLYYFKIHVLLINCDIQFCVSYVHWGSDSLSKEMRTQPWHTLWLSSLTLTAGLVRALVL